jgi:acyl-coenzyme A thioesterase PaaI-like protein
VDVKFTDPADDAFAGETDWLSLSMPSEFGIGRSFVSGDPHGDRLRIRYFLRESDKSLCAKAWFGLGAEGPPAHAHGGSAAAVLDEAMGFCAWINGHPVVAAEIKIRYRKQLPLLRIVHVETNIERVSGVKVFTKGRIFLPGEDRTFVEGEGLFIMRRLDDFGDKFKAMPQAQERIIASQQ